MSKQYRNPQTSNCESCGILDDLEFFEFVLDGITLCQDCADMPVRNVTRRNLSVN